MSIYKGDTLIAGGGLKSGTVSAGSTVQNVNDTVIEYWVASDKRSWYRIWASGWKECGVFGTSNNSNSHKIVYLPIQFTGNMTIANSVYNGTYQVTNKVWSNDIDSVAISAGIQGTAYYSSDFKIYVCGY